MASISGWARRSVRYIFRRATLWRKQFKNLVTLPIARDSVNHAGPPARSRVQMPALFVFYDPTDRVVLPMPDQVEQLHYSGVRFARLAVAPDLTREQIGATAGRLALLLLEQIAPSAIEEHYRIRVPREQEATDLPIYAVYDFGLTTWSLTTKPDHATRWVSITRAETDKEYAPQRIKLFGCIEEIRP
jgi:hypothetical protein